MGNLVETLQESQEYARRGYDLAVKSIHAIESSIEEERQKVKETQRNLNRIERGESTDILRRQQASLRQSEKMLKELKAKIKALKADEKEFTILVYGRTMVGKSTLMEVLTHGSGASIGKGSQRTTRDVRAYHWQGMRVIDVPGIASFDGEEDDRLADKAANAADMILFLISDDGVQQEEAKHLAYLRKLGKPILGLINVKVGIADTPRPLDLRRIEKKMAEQERIATICDQFRAFGDAYQQNWGELTFVPAHLKAAYLGQDQNEELWRLSNFPAVEQYIIEKVEKDGCFLRIKNFIDTVAYSLRERLAESVASASDDLAEGLLYRHKRNELIKWEDKFIDRVKTRYDSFKQRLEQKVAAGIVAFSEENYENENAGEAWKAYVEGELNLDGECGKFISDVAREWNRKKRELMDDFQLEMRFSSISVDMGDISMDKVTDWKTGIQAVAGIATFLGPVGWIGAGLIQAGIWLLFDSKSERIARQKRELADNLCKAMTDVLPKYTDQVWAIFEEKILGEGVDGLAYALNARDDLLLGLVDVKENSNFELATQLTEVNATLWQEACKYLHLKEYPLYEAALLPETMYVFGKRAMPKKEQAMLSQQIDVRLHYHALSREEYEQGINGTYFGEFYTEMDAPGLISYGASEGREEKVWECDFFGNKAQMRQYQQSEPYQLYQQFFPVPLYAQNQ